MDTKISVILGIINNVKGLYDRFQINKHQCKRLADFYIRTGGLFNQLEGYLNDAENQLPSLDVTISVLQKGELLLEKYTEQGWFDSMLISGVNQDSFVAIHVELEACIQSIHNVLHETPASLGKLLPLLFLIEDDRATLFKGDAEKDKKYMLGRIKFKKNTGLEARFSNSTEEQKSHSEIRSLDVAFEKISELPIAQELTTQQGKNLPSYLRIDSSEIELLKPIGAGGSAEVYKCRWLYREYAVKILRSGNVEGLRKEVENLIPLRHPNIVLLTGFSIRESDQTPMVVMELLDLDLHELINTFDNKAVKPMTNEERDLQRKLEPFPIEMSIDFMYQIATGMAYLHKKLLFHGDLKASNVLVKVHESDSKIRYVLKISDFGVAEKLVLKRAVSIGDMSDLSDNTSFNTANVGTTRWRAPEVFDITDGNQNFYSLKADVYCFAMTCVEILTRQVPYVNMSASSIRKYVKNGGRPELPSHVPEDLGALICRCWDDNPKKRPVFPEICTYMQGLGNHATFDTKKKRDSGFFSRALCCWVPKSN